MLWVSRKAEFTNSGGVSGLVPSGLAGIVWCFMNGVNAAWLRLLCGVLLLFLP
jgi:hypothetical protein